MLLFVYWISGRLPYQDNQTENKLLSLVYKSIKHHGRSSACQYAFAHVQIIILKTLGYF